MLIFGVRFWHECARQLRSLNLEYTYTHTDPINILKYSDILCPLPTGWVGVSIM